MKRQIKFIPGYDHIVQPSKKYGKEFGRHGMEIRFYLIGKKGAMQFVMYTGWMPMIKKGEWGYEPTYKGMSSSDLFPMAVDVGYHSHKRMYKGQTVGSDKCGVIGGRCFYDGSGLNAEPVMAKFLNKGEEALWKELEKYYKEIFGELK
jgi:hypothetical protein